MIRRYLIWPLGRLFRRPTFLACMVVLSISAGGLQLAAEKMQWHFRKEAVALRKPLDNLDERQLWPYEVVSKDKIENEDVLEELGTRDYLKWELVDTSVATSDPGHWLVLFVTYYTGDPGIVPHVPEICFQGGGSAVLEKEDGAIEVADEGGSAVTIPVRVVELSVPGVLGQSRRTVTYFFRVNGTYRCDRREVRRVQNNLRDRYAYFSKVELDFLGMKATDRSEALSATEKLSRKLVPILASEHWPDWAQLCGD